MTRPLSFLAIFVRQKPRSRQNPDTQIRNLSVEAKDGDFNGEQPTMIQNQGLATSSNQQYADFVKQVCEITRKNPRWEQTLLSEFPSFDFSDPQFFREVLREQGNVLLSLRFFYWLRSEYAFSPSPDCCSLLFGALVDAKAGKVAKSFLDQTDFSPEPAALERYLRCLCKSGLLDEAIHVFSMFNVIGFCPSIATCNLALRCCISTRRTDLVWKIYQDMMDSGVLVDANGRTIGYLIEGFCNDGKVSEGYKLLLQVLEDGMVPGHAAFNKLISGFSKAGNYNKVSELLHIMIARNRAPDIHTYHEVINGLCKRRMQLQAYRVFSDLKDRGYVLNRVLYTTMIHGLCKMEWLGPARKLWFEMINKGFSPCEYTYNALLHGYFRAHDLEGARKLYREMCDGGYGETTVSYNTMISGLCLLGQVHEAYSLFKEMPYKGISRDIITFNSLIPGLIEEVKISVKQGLQPSTFYYTSIIAILCKAGYIQEAEKWLNIL